MHPIAVDRGVYRGPRPTDMEALKAAGIHTILSLESGWFERLHGMMGFERRAAKRAGLSYHQVRMSGLGRAPTFSQVRSAIVIIRAFRERGIYVHCKQGVDRTGFVIAMYRVKDCPGWDVNRAISEWHERGFHSWWYRSWPEKFKAMVGGWR